MTRVAGRRGGIGRAPAPCMKEVGDSSWRVKGAGRKWLAAAAEKGGGEARMEEPVTLMGTRSDGVSMRKFLLVPGRLLVPPWMLTSSSMAVIMVGVSTDMGAFEPCSWVNGVREVVTMTTGARAQLLRVLGDGRREEGTDEAVAPRRPEAGLVEGDAGLDRVMPGLTARSLAPLATTATPCPSVAGKQRTGTGCCESGLRRRLPGDGLASPSFILLLVRLYCFFNYLLYCSALSSRRGGSRRVASATMGDATRKPAPRGMLIG
jgi:hypothetical protein